MSNPHENEVRPSADSAEVAARRETVRFAIANTTIEGGTVLPETEAALFESWASLPEKGSGPDGAVVSHHQRIVTPRPAGLYEEWVVARNECRKWAESRHSQTKGAVGECAARLGRACLAEKAAAAGAFGLRVEAEQEIPAVVFVYCVDIDFVSGERAFYRATDPGEGKLPNLVGPAGDSRSCFEKCSASDRCRLNSMRSSLWLSPIGKHEMVAPPRDRFFLAKVAIAGRRAPKQFRCLSSPSALRPRPSSVKLFPGL
jgi:hypothetical protein